MSNFFKFLGYLKTRRFLYFILFFLSLALCWLDPTNVFFTTFFSVFLLLRLIFCIRNRIIRNSLVIFVSLITFLTYFIYQKYGGLSTSMVMSTFGVGLSVSLGTVQTFGLKFLVGFLFILFVISLLSIKIPKACYSIKERVVLTVCLILILSKPVFDGISFWGAKFFINNLEYSPTFISQPYIDQYKIFFGPLISSVSIIAENIVDDVKYKKIDHEEYPDYIKNKTAGSTNIIYVIGESSNPGRYGIYGYGKDTTPNLSQMDRDGKICVVNNVHSPAAQTRLAVPMLVSFETPLQRGNLFKYKNLIEMAELQGYHTYWFDSQMQNNMWNKPFGYLAKYAEVLQTPEENNTRFPINEGQDEKLLPAIKHYFKESQERNFYVIHLMGNHLPYSARRGGEDNPMVDDYDASIYNVDDTLQSIFTFADSYLKDYKLVYVSDHGEVVGQGHGFPSSDNEMYKIPLLMNDASWCAKAEQLRNNNHYFSSDLTKLLVLEMMGYSVSDQHLRDAVKNSDFVLNEKEDAIRFSELRDVPLPQHP
ncbi:phosphoethanolamine transferase [Klebsiella aerogenes]|uniref:phosphoethanolamine transferase n=2 Tax=Klebsiella aerogenes TaxID=548 RepID=UPI000667CE67|nr:phosphoethanolamine transferase [Klebsiella aerogenes]EKT8944947.1 phosphoethanolamine transferase [Klebsiella aerogenes]EKV8595894.1 phosphoethanolamine transferase [Klebsiella aerogenes]ELA0067015.1 phosphoethanolamine transferase [Klebsiella aerogenes]MEB6108012.1 phosphoethanolamine transferase [Klebsiella aerogenes]MEB6600277.1 phosphoethanolamine transferase [Klebsiella aerogenes]